MSVSRIEVIRSYEFLLGRPPEDEFAILEKMRHSHSLLGLVEAITRSQEFKQRAQYIDFDIDEGDCRPLVAKLEDILSKEVAQQSWLERLGDKIRRIFTTNLPGDRTLILRICREFLPDNLRLYAIALLMMLVVSACSSLIAFLIGGIVNATLLDRNMTTVTLFALSWICLFVFRGLAAYSFEMSLARASNNITARVQKRIFSRLMVQGVGYFSEHRSSDFMTNAIMGAGAFGNIINQLLQAVGRDIFMILFLIATMLYYNPILTLICLCLMPLAFVSVEKLGLRASEIGYSRYAGTGAILSAMQEIIQGFRIVKAFRLEQSLLNRAGNSIDKLEKASNDLARVSNWSAPLVESLGGIAIGIACLYSGYQIVSQRAEPGDLVAFLLSFMLLFEPGRRLARLKIDLSSNLFVAQRLFDLFDAAAAEEGADARPSLTLIGGAVEFSGIHFGYKPGAPVLQDLSFKAEPGALTALVGLSGGGKSTIFNLLLRFYESTRGQILIDGQNISDVSLSSLRDAISYVGQDIYLFEGTIRENIIVGRPDATQDQVVRAAQAAFIHDFICSLPRGYETQVGEFGSLLSMGQRQRVSIARALLKDAPIVLLDEPTASLDAESDHSVQLAIRRLCQGKTTLTIAHRLHTIQDATNIYVLEQGRIVESGTHNDLVEKNGSYANFVKLQNFSNNTDEITSS